MQSGPGWLRPDPNDPGDPPDDDSFLNPGQDQAEELDEDDTGD